MSGGTLLVNNIFLYYVVEVVIARKQGVWAQPISEFSSLSRVDPIIQRIFGETGQKLEGI